MVREVSLMSLEALRRRRTSHAKLWFQRAQAEASTEQQEDGKEATEESCRSLKGAWFSSKCPRASPSNLRLSP